MFASRPILRTLHFLAALRWLAILPALGPALLAQETELPAFERVPALPPHPTVLTAEYHRKNLPVVAAEKDCPVVMVDGVRKVLANTTPLTTERAARYLPAKARLNGGIIKQYTVEIDKVDAPHGFLVPTEERVDVELWLTAEQYLADCFVMYVAYEENPPDSVDLADRNYAVIGVQEVGMLKAGEPKKISYNSRAKFPPRFTDMRQAVLNPQFTKMRYFWLLFSGGGEIQTRPSPVVAEFFHRRESLMHSLARTAWLRKNAGKDQPVKPMMMIPPLLENTEGLPHNASATLTIASDGTVSEVTLDQSIPFDATKVITTTLRAWLFMPAIKNGQPTPAKVRVPLQF